MFFGGGGSLELDAVAGWGVLLAAEGTVEEKLLAVA